MTAQRKNSSGIGILASYYKSVTVGAVAAVCGLIVPFLIPGNPNFVNFLVYLGIYFAADLLLAARLNRSLLALVGWCGTLALFLTPFVRSGGGFLDLMSPAEFYGSLIFLAVFFALNLLDFAALVIFERRRNDLGDAFRVWSTPLLFFFGAWAICRGVGHWTLFGVPAVDFFPRFGSIPAAALFLFYLALTVALGRRETAILEKNWASLADDPERAELAGELRPARSRFAFSHLSGTLSAGRIVAFVFLSTAVALGFSGDTLGVMWVALASGLLASGARKGTAWPSSKTLSRFTDESLRERVAALYREKSARAARGFAGWSALYMVFGAVFLFGRSLVPNLYPVQKFLDHVSVPLLNCGALPVLLGGLLAVGTAIFVRRTLLAAKMRNAPFGAAAFYTADICFFQLHPADDFVVRGRYGRGNGKTQVEWEYVELLGLMKGLAILYFAFGAVTLWTLLTSETFASVAAWCAQRKIDSAGRIGSAAIPLVWTAAGLIFYAVGFARKNRSAGRGLRIAALVCWSVTIPLLLIRLFDHPLFGVCPGGPAFFVFAFPENLPVSVTNLAGVASKWPLVNPSALPTFALGTLLAAFGVWVRNHRFYRGAGCEGEIKRKIASEYRAGLGFGLIGVAFLLLIVSFEGYAYFQWRPETFGTNRFWPCHALWTIWLASAAALWGIGLIFKSRANRIAGYVIFFGGLPFVFGGEFLTSDWRTNDAQVTTLLNPCAGVAFLYFLAPTLLGAVWGGKRGERFGRGERRAIPITGSIGLILLVTLLSFETVRYFADKTWFGPGDWTRLVALSILWTVLASILLGIGFLRRSALLRWHAITLFGVATVKVLTVDLARVDQIYRVGAFFVLAVALALAAAAYQRFKNDSDSP